MQTAVEELVRLLLSPRVAAASTHRRKRRRAGSPGTVASSGAEYPGTVASSGVGPPTGAGPVAMSAPPSAPLSPPTGGSLSTSPAADSGLGQPWLGPLSTPG
eukprot:CAMPEP_0196772512 /NCGR_PEP_ID=MMETSP1104-20130614/2270_1 /TAXON_ID=33652 /ORGANISM="Cafeteria sp., Strain Caron Lab Isolate" /LENGTH=101 /DNA_ID=CAMNT_0042142647 /DNA_START=412 /DNA_END=714 /DNA_ORIENTATION=+